MQIPLLGDDRNQFVRRSVHAHIAAGGAARGAGWRGGGKQIKSNTKLRFMFPLVRVGVCSAQCELARGYTR